MLGVGARLPACAREPISCGGRGRRRRLSLPPCSRPQIGPYRGRPRQRRRPARRCGDAGDPRGPITATGLRLGHLALGGYGGDWRDDGQQIDSRSDGAEGRYPRNGAPLFERRRPRSPLAAPIYADLTGLAPFLIQVGAAETLLDDPIRPARVAGAADGRVDLHIWPEMIHVWRLFHPELKASQRAIDEGGTFVRAHTAVKLA